MQWYAMASEVILTTLGPDWWKANCTTSSDNPDAFLFTLDETERGRYEHQERIIKLGDMLYALRSCDGYQTFVEALKRRDLEAVFFELWVADILAKSGYDVAFVESSGEKGADYDLTATKNKVSVTVEAKCRRSKKILNEQTLLNALGNARKQLPHGGPSLIFVFIPVEWTMDKKAEDVITSTINSFLRNTSRVNYVVVVWQQWVQFSIGKASVYKFRSFENLKPNRPLGWTQMVRIIENPILEASANQSFRPSYW
jgi:Holliday junction resolvase